MDIATLLETHRKHMLAVAEEVMSQVGEDAEQAKFALEVSHDRATTRTLLDIYRTEKTPAAAPVAVVPAPPKSRLIKPGSKAAKQRAEKAQRTRLENLARKAQDARANGGAATETLPELSTATHLARTEGGQ